MKVALVGPELEENLALRYLHASLVTAGHDARIFDFHAEAQISHLTRRIAGYRPDLVGLSMVFTSRAREFIGLAESLRWAGFGGHITAGGHFASFHAGRILKDFPALDSIVHGEGEEAIVGLVENLANLSVVMGLTYRERDGEIRSTPRRPHPDNLDSRPFPTRPTTFTSYLRLPIANVLAGRGCYGNCTFCSIRAWYEQNPGRRFRQRRPECVAREIAELYHERGVRIFNFHDDNFFLPGVRQNMARLFNLQRALDAEGVGHIGIQVKARPDSVEPETIRLLKAMGLFRVFLGVESNSVAGLKTLGRGIRREQNHIALGILRDLDIHTTFNLLMFDPEATPSDLRDNIAFMRRYAESPLNFGRVEIYSGTPLEKRLRDEGRLNGDYFGYTYRIADERSQRAFEMFRRIFIPRNFDEAGLNLQAMKLDYYFHLLAHFWPRRATPALRQAVKGPIAELNENNAALLSEICDFVDAVSIRDARETAAHADALAAARVEFDRAMGPRMQRVVDEISTCARDDSSRKQRLLKYAAAAAAVAVMITVDGCGCGPHIHEMMPPPRGETPFGHAYRMLTDDETAAVEARITEQYQMGLDELFTRYGLSAKLEKEAIKLHLLLGPEGEVLVYKIEMPEGVDAEGLEDELGALVNAWTFAPMHTEGACTVTLRAKNDWHMCEMMIKPFDEGDGESETSD